MMKLYYEKNEKMLNQYVSECREKINQLVFDSEEIRKGNIIKINLINEGKISKTESIDNSIKIYKNGLIDTKLNHTLRIVSDSAKTSQKIGLNDDFETLLKVSALLHDIARFNQAIWSNDFFDKHCIQFNGMNHAEYGHFLLYEKNLFKKFDIPKKYKFAIAQVVKYHQIPQIFGDLAIQFQNDSQLNVQAFLKGTDTPNNKEKIIIAALLQMVKDVDMLDIFYQHITGEIQIIRPCISFAINNSSLEEICKYWQIEKKVLMTYNNLENDNIKNLNIIYIPTEYINPEKLTVPSDIKESFFSKDFLNLKELQSRRDWTFITGMWWRLSHFLNNINFVANLEVLEEKNLLEYIYNMYPQEYKPLVAEAFEFAKEELLIKPLKEKKGKIYVKEKI